MWIGAGTDVHAAPINARWRRICRYDALHHDVSSKKRGCQVNLNRLAPERRICAEQPARYGVAGWRVVRLATWPVSTRFANSACEWSGSSYRCRLRRPPSSLHRMRKREGHRLGGSFAASVIRVVIFGVLAGLCLSLLVSFAYAT